MSQQGQPLCLLALDGGGVRGLSELIVLQELMLRVQKHRSLQFPPKPCELFDLIGGTSTGGLIAIMLGRLKMSVDEVLEEYCNIAKEVFGKPKRRFSEGTYSASTLEKVIKKAVERYGSPKEENGKASPELKLLEEGDSTSNCKVFVCSRNARAMNTARLFRSYRSYTAGDYEGMTVWQAARATSAAPTFFKRLKIGPQHAKEEFLDGGLGSNNPTKLLMEEAVKISDRQDPIVCIISIGTGKTNVTEFKTPGFIQKTLPTKLVDALRKMATDCETVEGEISQRFSANPGSYFRFNVEHGLENISLKEWEELGNIKAKTIAYLGDHRIAGSVNEAVVALCDRSPRFAASDLGSYTI
ncbi:FabD/lysophospholipase-like protein [Hyaloscypha bicolor E]|uniref:FabD/lysophospholipase-like protein n=1 Tax=Hyaloscypha bicolor E TaxID=1095630 RepID=A0A2J6T9S0_9HELO|nr:FabD/lysophospholipase-like protein [Hyaloscypha bicolor E]PMD59777.1 FabD/lysophospholipase-like protein [Hyaloscypha bicolor E]